MLIVAVRWPLSLPIDCLPVPLDGILRRMLLPSGALPVGVLDFSWPNKQGLPSVGVRVSSKQVTESPLNLVQLLAPSRTSARHPHTLSVVHPVCVCGTLLGALHAAEGNAFSFPFGKANGRQCRSLLIQQLRVIGKQSPVCPPDDTFEGRLLISRHHSLPY